MSDKNKLSKSQYLTKRGLKDAHNHGDFDNISPNQARQILHDKKVNGQPLTAEQYKLFGFLSKGNSLKFQYGGTMKKLKSCANGGPGEPDPFSWNNLDINGNPLYPQPTNQWVNPMQSKYPANIPVPEMVHSIQAPSRVTIDPNFFQKHNGLVPPTVPKKTMLDGIGKFIKENPAQVMNLGLGFLGNALESNAASKDEKHRATVTSGSDNLYPVDQQDRGDWTTNEGFFRPDQYVSTQFGAASYQGNGVPRFANGGNTNNDPDPKPIIVNNPNDPRLRAYQDSLQTYNYVKGFNDVMKKHSLNSSDYSDDLEVYNKKTKGAPLLYSEANRNTKVLVKHPNSNTTETTTYGESYFPKPVQPVVYQKGQPKPSSNELIGYSTNEELYKLRVDPNVEEVFANNGQGKSLGFRKKVVASKPIPKPEPKLTRMPISPVDIPQVQSIQGNTQIGNVPLQPAPENTYRVEYDENGKTIHRDFPNEKKGSEFQRVMSGNRTGYYLPIKADGGGIPNLSAGLMPGMTQMNVPDFNISNFTNIPAKVVSSDKGDSDSGDISSIIAAKESGGNYNALPKKKDGTLASSAVGKYQFLWNKHKNWISKVTGVTSKEAFRKNPEAQEAAFSYWDQQELTPWATKIKTNLGLNVPLNVIKSKVHFAGPKGAMDYYKTGKQTVDGFGTTTATYKEGGQYVLTADQISDLRKQGYEIEE